jgi:hypothetical protein
VVAGKTYLQRACTPGNARQREAITQSWRDFYRRLFHKLMKYHYSAMRSSRSIPTQDHPLPTLNSRPLLVASTVPSLSVR